MVQVCAQYAQLRLHPVTKHQLHQQESPEQCFIETNESFLPGLGIVLSAANSDDSSIDRWTSFPSISDIYTVLFQCIYDNDKTIH